MSIRKLTTRRHFNFSMPEGQIPYLEHSIAQSGVYEPETEDCIYSVIQPGMRIAECGACCGYHALNLAKATGPEGRVICFEANPNLIDILNNNLAENGFSDNTTVVAKGVWSSSCLLPFPIPRVGLGRAGFHHASSLQGLSTAAFAKARALVLQKYPELRDLVQVEVVSLDDYFGDSDIDFLRMDIEGAELEVLNGAGKLLSRTDVGMILECTPENNSEAWSLELYDTLSAMGYRIYRILAQGLTEIRHRADFHAKHQAQCQQGQRDVLCRKDSRLY